MQNFASKAFLAAAASLAVMSEAAEAEPRWKLKVSMEDYTTEYFQNKVDHFNPADESTYSQRFWHNDKFFAGKENEAPVFLYICGEWTCTPPDEQMFPMMVGAQHGAMLFSLEHRYYGDSQPFDNWSTDNLEKGLSSEQALADIATFIEAQNKDLLGYEADWIVIGGSYPGALSAWFKSQYPDHAVGAWSSSGVIHAIKDFKTFDLDIFMRTDNSSPNCSNAIKQADAYVQEQFKTSAGTKHVADLFGISIPIDQRDFNFYFADIFVTGVQYGNRVGMCADLVAADADSESLIEAVTKLASTEGLSYDQYDSASLAKTEIDINSSLRQWTFQYCNEFGFFQTPNDEQPMRAQALELAFWPDYCERIFGRHIETQTEQTNKFYGGLDITGDNIFFLNGSEDPWQYAAMRQLQHPDTTQSTMHTQYIQCDTCAHCVDFHTPTDDQPEALTVAQNAVADQVAIWLDDAKTKRASDEGSNDVKFEDIDYEMKRLDLDERIIEGSGSVVFLQ